MGTIEPSQHSISHVCNPGRIKVLNVVIYVYRSISLTILSSTTLTVSFTFGGVFTFGAAPPGAARRQGGRAAPPLIPPFRKLHLVQSAILVNTGPIQHLFK